MRLARQYAEGAATLSPALAADGWVSYYLYGHGIELALKAFLVSQGTTEGTLRKLGHDLTCILRTARTHTAFAAVTLSAEEEAILALLDSYYRAKGFEYLRTGAVRLPLLAGVGSLATSLIRRVEPIVDQAARTAISAGAS